MSGRVSQKTIRGEAVNIRPTSDEDLELLASWFADLQFVIWWGGKPKTREEVRREYLDHDPARQAYIVEADGEPIGYIQAWSDEPPDGGIDIVLKPEAQGRGLGVDAVRALALHLRAAGWKRITIDPRAENYRAIEAFEKAGFVREHDDGGHVILAFETKD
ncbi:MAG: GNAT family N-acetyltransferase [Candidatus Cybelea sp.]